jgi:hypothetical protein
VKTSSKVITAAYVSSESGDHYLEVFEGYLSDEEIIAKMDWEDPDCLYVQQKEVVEFG